MYNQNLFYPQQPQMMPQQRVPKRTEIDRVRGREGAMDFPMFPNCEAMLLDETAPIVWLVQTDMTGMKTLSPYLISPYKPEKEVTLSDLDARLKRIEEEMINHDDAESNAPDDESKPRNKKG